MSVAPYEIPRGAVMIGGKAWPCARETTLWTDSGLSFRAGRGGRQREQAVNLVVWHFTGGSGNAHRVHKTLNERSLGVDFIIDAEGMIWQCSDPVNVCTYHAGIANGRSVGIEIVGRGEASLPEEPQYEARVHGRKIRYLRFAPAQLKAACALAETLSTALDIPRRVPAKMAVMQPHELSEFTGHLGHLHITANKIDPGTELFEAFRERGFDAV